MSIIRDIVDAHIHDTAARRSYAVSYSALVEALSTARKNGAGSCVIVCRKGCTVHGGRYCGCDPLVIEMPEFN